MPLPKSFIPVAEPDLKGNEKKYLDRCISSSWISSKGEFINKFERSFADFIGVKHAISVNSGTAALHLALLALKIGKDGEVILPDLTFVASANAIAYTGAKPIFADVENTTWNIDPKKILEKITKKTKAIMIVHLYGQPAEMDRILKIAKEYSIPVIEDAAEAHGAAIKSRDLSEKKEKWRRVGGLGKIGCFSFYGNKIVTTGEGGMVVTDNVNLASRMRVLRDHGQTPNKRYFHELIGFNYRMTNLQAAIGLAQMERINEFIRKKRWIAEIYRKNLSDISGITFPQISPEKRNVYWLFSILIDKPFPQSRDQLIEKLKKENIETRPFFYPLHTLPPYRNKVEEEYPCASYLSTHGMNLPSSVNLTEEKIKRITDIIKK